MIFANLSGGRDSTAMIVRALELGERIDYILFCDLGYEFEAMYDYLGKLGDYLKSKFGKKITRIDCRGVFEKWAFEYPIQRGEAKGKLRGLPKEVGLDFCTREGKVKPSREFVLKVGSSNPFSNKVMIGYTSNEVKRGRTTTLDYAQTIYPLAEWGWNEKECEDFLRDRGIANTLYKHFNRTGCYFCPHQSKESLYNLYKHYPKEWETAKSLEQRAKELQCLNQTFKIGKTLKEYEIEFERVSESFDFGDDYVGEVVCFCK